jgi:hypothetical protein
MSRKKRQIKFSNLPAERFVNSETARAALRERVGSVYPEDEYDLDWYVEHFLKRITEHPESVDYTEPERLFDEKLPQVLHLNIVNPRYPNERTLLMEIDVPNVRAHLRDRLISGMAIQSGFEDLQGNIINQEEYDALYADLTSETTPDMDFELMELTAGNFFLRFAPKILMAFYSIMLRASCASGVKTAIKAPRNVSRIPVKAHRRIEDEAKRTLDQSIEGLKAMLKSLLEIKDGGRWRKESPPEGSPLAVKVETYLKLKTKQMPDGSFRFPPIKSVLAELNNCPELLDQKRKVLKGDTERRLFTARNLYKQLKADGYPMSVIKQGVKNLYSANIN